MKVYLVWEREYFDEYDVVAVFDSLDKAVAFTKHPDRDPDMTYSVTEKEVQ